MNSDDNDFYTFYKKSQALNFDALSVSKYLINSILIIFSNLLNTITKINSMHIYGFFKGFIQYVSVICFTKNIVQIYGKRISFFTLIIFLFDPYLFSLKVSLLRDDLICSFALLFIGAFIGLNNKGFSRIRTINLLPFLIALLGLLGTKPIYAPMLLGLLYFLPLLNYDNLIILKKFKINKRWLILPIFFVFFYLIGDFIDIGALGGYKAQVLDYFTPSIKNILITFKNHLLSPLPGNQLIRKGLLITDASKVYWWFEIRFIFVFFSVLLTLISILFNPRFLFKSISVIGFTGLIISFSYSQVQDLDIVWGLTAGPRQGYLSYLLLVPGSLSLISKSIFKR